MRIHLTVPGAGTLSCEPGTPWQEIANAICERAPAFGTDAWAGPMRLGRMHRAGAWPLLDGCTVAVDPAPTTPHPPNGPSLLDRAGVALAPLDSPIVISRLRVDVPPGTSLLVVADAAVDAPHARITPEEGGWELTDLDSRNGTAVATHGVRGLRVRRALITAGSTLVVGRTSFSIEATVATSRPARQETYGPDDDASASATSGGPHGACRQQPTGLRIGVDDYGVPLRWDPKAGPLLVVAAPGAGMSAALGTVRARAVESGTEITTADLGGMRADLERARRLQASLRTGSIPSAIGLPPELAMAAPGLIAAAAMTVCLGITCADAVHATVGGRPDLWASGPGVGLARIGAIRARIRIDNPQEAGLPAVTWIGAA